ncbi:MAG: hypothetical protein M1821_003159 [Bathelium mastoideum]|nr:MAG: hypothetical protein M1821_003159 [Bathelium mastoideum]
MTISNRFSSLQLHHNEPQGSEETEIIEAEGNPASHDSKDDATHVSAYPRFVDDALGEAIELRNDIEVHQTSEFNWFESRAESPQEIQNLFAVVTDTWKQAGQDRIPFLVATAVSHAAFAAFEDTAHRLKTTCDVIDPKALLDKHLQMAGMYENYSNPTASEVVLLFARNYTQLQRCKVQSAKDLAEQASSWPQSARILHNGPDLGPDDDECIAWIVHDMVRHMFTNTMRTASFYRVASPVWPDLGYFLTHNNEESDCLRCSFGLQLLLKSFKSYLFAAEPKIQPSACRLQALRFVQEALPNVGAVLDDATMPCRCPDTLAFYLEKLYTDLTQFLKAKEFDFYFQSPWVSGSHTMEILEALFYYGLRLFSYRNIVGSVMHVYNALRHFNSLKAIRLFDEINNAFNDILFPGGRPSRNFRSSYVRHMGARLHFHSNKDHTGCHTMAIPAHAAKATAGFRAPGKSDDPRFDYKKTSFFFHIKRHSYLLDGPTWAETLDMLNDKTPNLGDGTKHGIAKSRHQCSHHRHQTTPSCPRIRLETLRDALTTDFSQPICTARINFFKLYLTCVRIVSRISDEYHGKDAKPGQRCLCFAENLLLAADRCRDNERRFQYYCCKDLVDICQRAMVEEVGDAEAGEFVWKGIH